MKVVTIILLIFHLSFGDRACDKHGVLFYEELGCSPEGTKDGCPESFKCPEYFRSENYCNFKGHKIQIRESLTSNLTGSSCNVGCFCSLKGDKAGFTCAVLDCPEWLHGGVKQKTCYNTYSLDKCCSSGEVCEPYPDDTKCEVDGEKYRAGEKFYPKGTCFRCICQKGFEGKFEEPFCSPQVCAFEIRNSEQLEKFCAPVYYLHGEEAKCCPSMFICEEEDDVITLGEPTEKKCKFGTKELNIGATFNRTVTHYGSTKNVECNCQIPPYLTCHAN